MNFDFNDLQNIATFGVAGNFTGHLEQAGEAKDFKDVITKEKTAPKAIFPTYIPLTKSSQNQTLITPKFLTSFPFDSKKIIYPKGEQKIQLEPECAIIFEVEYEKTSSSNSTQENIFVKNLTPLYFGASNDCSIRKEGATKISQKKNWGASSKGISENLINIDNFTCDGILNKYRIASFMIRDSKVFTYGQDSAVRDYSYIWQKLILWMIEKLNTQQDEGPTENINSYLKEANFPKQILISIGATCYTDFGQKNFLQSGDKSVVILYPQDKYSFEQIKSKLEHAAIFESDISVLCQTVEV